MYCNVSGLRDLIPFVTSSVMGDTTASGHILRGDGDIDAWLRPMFQTPFGASVDKVIQGVSEAFGAAYALEAYTGSHMSNKVEKVDELRRWAVRRLNMVLEKPTMLTVANHPRQSPWGSHTDNNIMYSLPSNVQVVNVNEVAEEWRFGSRSEQSV
jgi:hypothetical protein